ncbi:phage tail assembly protein [Rickettsiales bacterium]|nr:phage tail assembly protein [Rickettsiales bacterium]
MQNIKLNYPIESDGANITDLNMRRSKVKDRLIVAKMKNSSDEEKEIRLFANLCEVSPNIIEELDESDYANLQKAYMDFFKSEGI